MQTAIEAAYARLRELYDPARLDGAADELVDLGACQARRDRARLRGAERPGPPRGV